MMPVAELNPQSSAEVVVSVRGLAGAAKSG
jgi:hypothetical protein